MNNILNNKNKDEVKEELKKVIDIGIDFKCQENFAQNKFAEEQIQELLKTQIKGVELDKLLEKFKEEILPYCSNFSTINFIEFPDAGNSIAGLSGAIFTDLLQQNLINSSFCALIATFMEIVVIKWLRELVSYNIKSIKNIYDVGGIITYGGTGSNATAMLLARENHRKNTMSKGVTNPSDYKVIIPKGIGHYSIRSSCMWLGCGNNIIVFQQILIKY